MQQELARIAGRYTLKAQLGAGGFGVTWRAHDAVTGQEVVLKRLDLRRAGDWKAVELFEREAQTMRGLEHPAIPAYLDAFEVQEGEHAGLYIAQAIAPGQPLSAWIAEGRRVSVEDACVIATRLLEVLVYLQGLHPPVIHRDIKPDNVLVTDALQVSVVDFGAVKASARDAVGGSTVVGTFGYMAPEQFRGVADLSTDLYGLGVTLIALLTRMDPSALPTRRMRLDYSDALTLPAPLEVWLNGLIEPDADARTPNAQAALDQLKRASHAEGMDALTQAEVTAARDADPSEAPVVARDALPLASDERAVAREARAEALRPSGWMSITLLGGGLPLVTFMLLRESGLIALAMWCVVSGMLATWLSFSLGPAKVLAHPESKRADSRASVMAFGLWALCLVSPLGMMLAQESLLYTLAACVLGATSVTLLTVSLRSWLRYRRQLALERALEVELPMVTDARFALTAQRAGGQLTIKPLRRASEHAIALLPSVFLGAVLYWKTFWTGTFTEGASMYEGAVTGVISPILVRSPMLERMWYALWPESPDAWMLGWLVLTGWALIRIIAFTTSARWYVHADARGLSWRLAKGKLQKLHWEQIDAIKTVISTSRVAGEQQTSPKLHVELLTANELHTLMVIAEASEPAAQVLGHLIERALDSVRDPQAADVRFDLSGRDVVLEADALEAQPTRSPQ